jgi:uncharacterized tellurite resistance protein B-like protein
MLNDIIKFFEERLMTPETAPESVAGVEYATAALMIELAKADFAEDDVERGLILELLTDTFDLKPEELDELVRLAESASKDASDLFQFTRLVNQHYSYAQKVSLLENFWKVAYADGRLDKYEEQFIRKVAGLLNLAPSEFSKTKMKIKQSRTG